LTYQKIAQSTSLPLSLAKAKTKLQIETEGLDEDAVEAIDVTVTDAILAAAELIEDQTKFGLRPTTWTLTLCEWPCFPFDLDRAPVRDVVAIRYLDEDKVSQTLSEADWDWFPSATGAMLWIDNDVSLPATAKRPDAVVIEFEAGFDIPGETGGTIALAQPERIKQALSLLTGHFYNNRDAVGEARSYALEMGATMLLDTVRLFK